MGTQIRALQRMQRAEDWRTVLDYRTMLSNQVDLVLEVPSTCAQCMRTGDGACIRRSIRRDAVERVVQTSLYVVVRKGSAVGVHVRKFILSVRHGFVQPRKTTDGP